MKNLLLTALLLPAASLFATEEPVVQAEAEVSAQVQEEVVAETRGRSGGHWHHFVASLIANNSDQVEAALNQLATHLAQQPETKLPSRNRVARMYEAACARQDKAVDLTWFSNLYERLVALLTTYLRPANPETESVVVPVVAEDDATDAELGLEEEAVPAEASVVEMPVVEEVVTPTE